MLDGATVGTPLDLDIATSTITAAYNIQKSSSYYWVVGYRYIGSYDSVVWRLDLADLGNLTVFPFNVGGNEGFLYSVISTDGNYLQVYERATATQKLFGLSTGTPTALGSIIATYTLMSKICDSSNTKWMMHLGKTDLSSRTIHRSIISNISVGGTYNHDLGSFLATDKIGDMKFIGSYFYGLFYDSTTGTLIVTRYDDSDVYGAGGTPTTITPDTIDTAGNITVNTHSFIDFDGTQGLLITTMEGKIDAGATASGNYDIVIKLFDLPS